MCDVCSNTGIVFEVPGPHGEAGFLLMDGGLMEANPRRPPKATDDFVSRAVDRMCRVCDQRPRFPVGDLPIGVHISFLGPVPIPHKGRILEVLGGRVVSSKGAYVAIKTVAPELRFLLKDELVYLDPNEDRRDLPDAIRSLLNRWEMARR